MPVQYDPAIIQRFANRLYGRARTIVFLYTFIIGVFGLFLGGIASEVLKDRDSKTAGSKIAERPLYPFAIGGFFFGWIGFLIGSERGFTLRLQAQTALCQKQIEENTRPAQGHLSAMPADPVPKRRA